MSTSESLGPQKQQPERNGKVIGIGGVFFKSENSKELTAWYEQHLGFHADPKTGVNFPWKTADGRSDSYRTVWAVFPHDTRYFDPSTASLMFNYVVDDLDAILARLRAEGVQVDSKTENDAAGRFGWIYDSDGNKIELWEPVRAAS